jgi:hypothetical protein
MAATTTASTTLISKLRRDFKEFSFKKDTVYKWSPGTKTVHFRPLRQPEDAWTLLHELAHGILGHFTFKRDIELVGKEVEAWEYAAVTLSPKYGFVIPPSVIEEELETYRDWLHNRSICPDCSSNGIQTKTDTYQCLNCRCLWRVNDARTCELRRYKLSS